MFFRKDSTSQLRYGLLAGSARSEKKLGRKPETFDGDVGD